MLQRGWIKLFWGRCRDFVVCQKWFFVKNDCFLLKRLPKLLLQLIISSPSLMPTISARCAFYIAIWMRKLRDKQPNSSKWQPEKSALPTLSKYKSLANTTKRHLDFLPNDGSYNIQLKSLIVSSRGETSGVKLWGNNTWACGKGLAGCLLWSCLGRKSPATGKKYFKKMLALCDIMVTSAVCDIMHHQHQKNHHQSCTSTAGLPGFCNWKMPNSVLRNEKWLILLYKLL